MKFRRHLSLGLLLIVILLLMRPENAFATLSPDQLMRYNRVDGRDPNYKITQQEYSAYWKLHKEKLTNPAGYQLTKEEVNLDREIRRKFFTLTPKELAVYKKLSEDKCLNILLMTGGGHSGVIYNGAYLASPDFVSPFPPIYYAHIAGDRLAYVNETTNNEGWPENHLIVDNEDRGKAVYSNPRSVILTEDHVAWFEPRTVETTFRGEPTQSTENYLIFDGKDMGITKAWDLPSIDEGRILYSAFLQNGESHVFMDGKDMGRGVDIDIEGSNVAIVDYRGKKGDYKSHYLKLNGKKIHEFGSNTWTNITLKDGHRAYSMGPGPGTSLHHVYYDGKNLGLGTSDPLIEKNHLGYTKWSKNPKELVWPKFVYDKKEIGPIASSQAILAGDHFAFMQRVYPPKPGRSVDTAKRDYPDFLSKVNIDGKQYPGIFSDAAYVEITKKSSCKP